MFTRPSPEQHRQRRQAEKEAHLAVLMLPTRALHRGKSGGSTTAPAPKPEARVEKYIADVLGMVQIGIPA